jgi:drug/metabolite transporter (DMT)-like permease
LKSARWGGVLLAAGGAVGFASKGIFAKFLYSRGMSFDTLLALRSALSLPVMWVWVLWLRGWRSIRSASREAVIGACVGGVTCYCAGALLNFYALTMLAASVERVILFSYPAMIVLAGMMLGRGRPAARAVIAIVLTYLGIFFTVGGFDAGLLRANSSGAIDVLICAATYAFYFLVSERYVGALGSQQFALFAMTAAGAALTLLFSVRAGWSNVHLAFTDWALMAGLVLFATVLPMFLAAEGVRRIGAQRAALAGTVGPVATLVFASLLLHERLSSLQLLGSGLIVVGILVLELKRTAVVAEAPA